MQVRRYVIALITLFFLSLTTLSLAQPAPAAAPAAAPAPAAPPAAAAPAHLLLLTQSKAFVHPVTVRKGPQPSLVERTFSDLADKTKLFTVEPTQDAAVLTAEKLKATQIVVFYTTGDLAM